MAAGELLEMLESLPRGAVEASVRLMRGYNRTGEWPEPILTSPAPQRGRSPSPADEREILGNQQEITTLTVIWARQLVSPQPKLGPVP